MSIVLWYCPPQDSVPYELLKQLITSLQTMFPYSPVFEPHITLNTNLTCYDQDSVNQVLTACLAAMQPILKQLKNNQPLVSFNGLTIGRNFFRKVVLNCNDNKYLISIQKIIQEMYVEEKFKGRPFQPHVSLLYSDINPISRAYVRIIQERLQDALDVKLFEGPTNMEDVQISWNFDKKPGLSWNIPGTFKVVKCEGPLENWEILGKVEI